MYVCTFFPFPGTLTDSLATNDKLLQIAIQFSATSNRFPFIKGL